MAFITFLAYGNSRVSTTNRIVSSKLLKLLVLKAEDKTRKLCRLFSVFTYFENSNRTVCGVFTVLRFTFTINERREEKKLCVLRTRKSD
jgi:hypothetical protein